MRNYKGGKNTFDKSKRYNSFGVTVNSFNYFGDLSPSDGWASTEIGRASCRERVQISVVAVSLKKKKEKKKKEKEKKKKRKEEKKKKADKRSEDERG